MGKVIPRALVQPYTQDVVILPSNFWGAPVLLDDNGHAYCPGFLGNTMSNPWDAVQIPYLSTVVNPIAGLQIDQTPGVCEVNIRRGRKLDRKKSAGSDGQRLTFTGIENADVEIAITIWTPEQLQVLNAAWAVLQPPSGKGTPAAWDVKHPQFDVNGIKSICFVDSMGLADGKWSRSKTFVIKAVEYLPPTGKTTKTPPAAYTRGSLLDSQYPAPGTGSKDTGP